MFNRYFALLTGATLLACSCSSEKEPAMPGNVSDGNVKYISVALTGMPETKSATRAAGDVFEGQDPDGDSTYEYGSEDENRVTRVRFYFFEENGAAAKVKARSDGSYFNYFDWSLDENENEGIGDDAPNIEKILNATLVINTKAGDKLPASVVAVVNPSTNIGDDNRDLASLREVLGNYKESIGTGFTMSNSVYLGSNNVEVTCTPIPQESIQDTPEGALLQPVTIYVERVVSKVRLSVDEQAFAGRIIYIDGDIAIALKDASDDHLPIMVDGKQVYARFTNWNLTSFTTKSFLNKHVNPVWMTNTDFTSWQWNFAPFFRSFWAWNCPDAGREYPSYNELIGSTGAKFGTQPTEIYCQENAASYGNYASGVCDEPTMGIMGAVLCYADGTPVEYYKFLGQTLVGEQNLLTSMLNSIQSRGSLYSREVVNGKVVFSEISLEDVQLETAAAAGKAELKMDNAGGRYHSFLTLSDTGAAKKWYPSNDENQDATPMRESQVIEFIQNITGQVSLWNDGMTYYYFPIAHKGKIGDDGKNYGKYGIVRNHIYNSVITELYGLGTPVYNPNEKIYPEKPADNDSYIAAQIEILSWHVVNNDVVLEWPD